MIIYTIHHLTNSLRGFSTIWDTVVLLLVVVDVRDILFDLFLLLFVCGVFLLVIIRLVFLQFCLFEVVWLFVMLLSCSSPLGLLHTCLHTTWCCQIPVAGLIDLIFSNTTLYWLVLFTVASTNPRLKNSCLCMKAQDIFKLAIMNLFIEFMTRSVIF